MLDSLTPLIVPAALWVLIAFSVVTWALLMIKVVQFGRQKSESRHFLKAFWASPDLSSAVKQASQLPGGLARIVASGVDAMNLEENSRSALAQSIDRSERVERHLKQQIQKERRHLEAGLAVLASIGSTSPFIGLFGTVWGIMNALQVIGQTGSASLETVAGPIGHALLATGVGIAVAVPAVLIYNFFLRRLKLSIAYMDDFAYDFYSLAQRSVFTISQQPIVQNARIFKEAS
ncbi:MotA/TolQ/ExbB proton channel family protein [Pseudomonas sp. Mn2068]|uniref:MotA/TolQ/ExbB proton channel family protein n=1 Tax=Pseudomonas sp. Mn2068 TaxID=3395265 RepID=UPI003BBAAC3C